MSWSFDLTAKDSELDQKIKERITTELKNPHNPHSRQALHKIRDHVLAQLFMAPKDATFVVTSSGHYNDTGEGEHRISVKVQTAEALALNARLEQEAADRQKQNETMQGAATHQPVGALYGPEDGREDER